MNLPSVRRLKNSSSLPKCYRDLYSIDYKIFYSLFSALADPPEAENIQVIS